MSGSISLPYYPSTNRTFGFFADVDGSKANTSLFQQRALLFGYMLDGGTAVPGVAVLVTSLAQVAVLTGYGSMIYEMVAYYLRQDTFGELWIMPLAAPADPAQKATGNITIQGTASASGTLSVYVGGVLIACPVSAGDTGLTVMTRLTALMTFNKDLAVTTVFDATKCTLTARHGGILGNDIDLRSNFRGAAGGEADVTGLTVFYTPMQGGSGVPANLTAALATLGETTYDFVGNPFTDSASLDAFDAFFNESTGRWSWQQMLYGGYYTAYRGSVGALATFGESRNSKFGDCLMVLPDEPEPVWLHVADYTAIVAVSQRADPGVPLQEIVLGTLAPPSGLRITRSLRNTLLYDGISTKSVNHAGQNVLERSITFYQTNLAGVPDNSFLDQETMGGLAYLLRRWQSRMSSLFSRKKLVQDGTPIPAGSNMVSPSTIKYSTIGWYREECIAGNAQDPDGFAKAIVAQNAGNGLVKELLPFILVNQLRAIAALAQFTKP